MLRLTRSMSRDHDTVLAKRKREEAAFEDRPAFEISFKTAQWGIQVDMDGERFLYPLTVSFTHRVPSCKLPACIFHGCLRERSTNGSESTAKTSGSFALWVCVLPTSDLSLSACLPAGHGGD